MNQWAPPRDSDSPISQLDSRAPKGRGKRGRGATGTPIELETRKNLRSSKGKGKFNQVLNPRNVPFIHKMCHFHNSQASTDVFTKSFLGTHFSALKITPVYVVACPVILFSSPGTKCQGELLGQSCVRRPSCVVRRGS